MLLDQINESQIEFSKAKSRLSKKKLGQYLTNDSIAHYMASLFHSCGKLSVRILDAGAGSGMLSIATVMRCIEVGIKEIHVELFEIDREILPLLESHLVYLQNFCFIHDVALTYAINDEDFLLAEHSTSYDYCSLNPPYFKSKIDSPYHSATADLFNGSPNVYASFVARALSLLNLEGQLVFLTPRSFTNGFYFKGFRKFLIDNAALEQCHVFTSRSELFKDSKVLQENIIVKLVRSFEKPETIKITTSNSYHDLKQTKVFEYPYDFIVRGNVQNFIFLPESESDAEAVSYIEGHEQTFSDLGFCISTGPIVQYRTSQVVDESNHAEPCVPLINSHYLAPLNFRRPSSEKHIQFYAYRGDYKKWLIRNSCYVMLKRISSKDDIKRIIAAVYTKNTLQSEYLAVENHVNVIGHSSRELDVTEAYGLAIYLQSIEFERYFKCLSGSTQVNATDIRNIPVPPLGVLKQMGRDYLKTGKVPYTMTENELKVNFA